MCILVGKKGLRFSYILFSARRQYQNFQKQIYNQQILYQIMLWCRAMAIEWVLSDMKAFIFFTNDTVFFGIILRTILCRSEKLTKMEYPKV